MLPKSIKYFYNISLPYGDGIDRGLGFACRQNSHKATLWKQYVPEKGLDAALCTTKQQGFGREKDGNHCKFIGSNLVIFCYKEFEKFALCKSISQSEVIFTVYSEPIEKNDFS